MKKLILFLFFAVTTSLATAQVIDLKLQSEQYKDNIKIGSTFIASGLAAGFIGSAVKSENIAFTGAGLFTFGVAYLFSASNIEYNKIKPTSNGLAYQITGKRKSKLRH
jgi:hypothetical protein